MLRNLDEVLRWVSFLHPVITPRGQVEKGSLVIKMMMPKMDNKNAYIYWAPPVYRGLS